jgi:hypothetical protein
VRRDHALISNRWSLTDDQKWLKKFKKQRFSVHILHFADNFHHWSTITNLVSAQDLFAPLGFRLRRIDLCMWLSRAVWIWTWRETQFSNFAPKFFKNFIFINEWIFWVWIPSFNPPGQMVPELYSCDFVVTLYIEKMSGKIDISSFLVP